MHFRKQDSSVRNIFVFKRKQSLKIFYLMAQNSDILRKRDQGQELKESPVLSLYKDKQEEKSENSRAAHTLIQTEYFNEANGGKVLKSIILHF